MSSRRSASWQSWVGAWLLGGMLILTGSGCSKESAPTEPNPPTPTPNNAPEVMSLTANPSQVQIGRNADVVAEAQDADGDPLIYEWRAELGAIFGDGSSVVYAAGSCCPGTDTIHLTVKDNRGGSAAATVPIQVTP
ncbi:MAG: hypothetical protein HZC42_15725 [Candidatus Eisenbacteria bacterium]|nr:hypothetical protein [Candidatus Eisenbacteria bacterium]